MQPSAVPRHEYPDQCEREQSHLRRFAKFRLAGEETGDDNSGSDSSHAEEFWFRVGYKRDGHCIRDGGYVRELPPPTPREAYLPQRPEHAHERGNDGDTEQAQ